MRRTFIGLTAVAVLALTAGQAAAQKQDIKMRGYFGIGGGVGLPLGDFADAAKLGWVLDAIGGFTTRGGIFGGRADVMWAQNGVKDIAGGGHNRLLGLNADLVLTPGHRPANVHPYFLIGAGFYNAKQSTATGSETKLAFNTGAGVQIHTGHRMDLFLEGRFLSIRTAGRANMIPIVFGIRWGGI